MGMLQTSRPRRDRLQRGVGAQYFTIEFVSGSEPLFPARLDSRLPVTDAKHSGSLRHLLRPLFLWSDLRLPQLEPKRFFVTLVALNACGKAAHLQYRGDTQSSYA